MSSSPHNPSFNASAEPLPKLGIVISMFPELHETFILRELAALERSGVQFEVFSLQYPRDPVTLRDAKRLMQERTHYARLCSRQSLGALLRTALTRPWPLLRTLLALGRVGYRQPIEFAKCLAILPISLHFGQLAKRAGITHLHGHWANIPTTACWYLQQIEGFSWSAAIHGEDIFSPNPILSRKLPDACFTVVCSGYFFQHLKTQIGHPQPEHIHCNYHGLEPLVWEKSDRALANTHSTDSNNDKPTADKTGHTVKLLSIGRLVPTKGHDHLINACAALNQSETGTYNWQLEIIGSGPEQARLQSQIQALGLTSHVTLSGPRDFEQVLDAIAESDVFCLPAKMIPGQPPDGIPNVLAEAMAFGKPVISSDMGAIPELISDQHDGLLVKPADEHGLHQALSRLIESAELRDKLGQAARHKVAKRFNQQHNIDELIELFQRYIPRSPSVASEKGSN